MCQRHREPTDWVVGSPGRRAGRRDGSALIIVMVMIMSLMVLALVTSQDAVLNSRSSSDQMAASRALWAAEVGVGLVVNDLAAAGGSLADNTDGVSYSLGDATCQVSWSKQGQYYRIQSAGTASSPQVISRTVEVFVKSQDHPLFFKATYVANQQIGPDGKPARLVNDFALVFGARKVGGATFNETRPLSGSDKLSERDHQVDFNNDGVMDANVKVSDIFANRAD